MMRVLQRIIWGGALIGVLGAVVWCGLAPSPDMAELGWMPRWLGRWANENPTFRNFPAFGLLAAAIYSSGFVPLESGRGALAFFSAVASSAVALAVELSQLLLPTRFFDPDDIAWSMAGALSGAFFVWLLGSLRKRSP